VQDWLIGVAQTDNPTRFWTDLKKRAKKGGAELYARCVQLPYQSSNGKTYRLDHADAETLYLITQRMDVNTGIRGKVLAYLAKAGVFVDEARIDPESAVESIEIARRAKWEREGKSEEWVKNREYSIYTRKRFTELITQLLGKDAPYGEFTNTTYRGVLKTDAAGLRSRLGLRLGQNPRDYLGNLPLIYVAAAEEAARIALSEFGEDELLPVETVRQVITVVSKTIGLQAQQTADLLRIDLVTGQKLLIAGE
jgi:hypothetical protein